MPPLRRRMSLKITSIAWRVSLKKRCVLPHEVEDQATHGNFPSRL